ncbi:MAG: hypothetical protein ACK6DP_06265 [Gemmatimonas sp.]
MLPAFAPRAMFAGAHERGGTHALAHEILMRTPADYAVACQSSAVKRARR